MEEQKPTQQNTNTPAVVEAAASKPVVAPAAAPAGDARPAFNRGGFSRQGAGGARGGFGNRGGGGRGGNDRKPFIKKKEEFNETTLDMRRVARVMAGGKRFSFRATLVLGDNRGRVGVGIGKGIDVQQALAKAKRDAQKNMIVVPLQKRTIPHEVEAKFSAAHVRLKPAKEGNGLIAGGAVRAVLTLAGVKDITAKVLGRTPNKLTNAMATIEALKMLKSRKTTHNKQLITDNKEVKAIEQKVIS